MSILETSGNRDEFECPFCGKAQFETTEDDGWIEPCDHLVFLYCDDELEYGRGKMPEEDDFENEVAFVDAIQNEFGPDLSLVKHFWECGVDFMGFSEAGQSCAQDNDEWDDKDEIDVNSREYKHFLRRMKTME